MDGTKLKAPRGAWQLATIGTLMALAVPIGGSVQANDGAAAAVPVEQFSAEFASLATPELVAEASPGAVDITEIEPPIEIEEPAPQTSTRSLGFGHASYYGRRFHGRRTANGERFNMNAMTAAHKTLPFGTMVRVTNPRNGKSVTVRINDRGPFIRGRTIDLSRGAAQKIGLVARGHGRVELEIVE